MDQILNLTNLSRHRFSEGGLFFRSKGARIFKESLNMHLFLIDNNTVATLQNQIFIGSDTGKA
jgi:hypothetical protein